LTDAGSSGILVQQSIGRFGLNLGACDAAKQSDLSEVTDNSIIAFLGGKRSLEVNINVR